MNLIETKGTGIFSLLDEESKLPKHSSSHFTNEVHRIWNGHFRLSLPRASRLKAHREIRDDEGFLVRHFAGAVCYQTEKFIEKNNDALHMSLECLVQESRNKFLQSLFPPTNNTQQKGGKLAFDSVGLKFKTQLGELMDKLKSTGTSFVRCIKPNEKMVDHRFEGASILSQLQCSGMTSVLELMQMGYPSRAIFSDLYNMYKVYMTEDLKRLDPRLFCRVLLHAMGMNDKDYSFGITKLFFRPGKFSEFDTIMKSDPENLKNIITKVRTWLVKHRWREAQYCVLAVIKLKNKILYRRENLVTIQKNIKMYLCKKKHQPRYGTIIKIKELDSMTSRMESIIQQLKNDKTCSESELKELRRDLISSKHKIQTNPNLKAIELDELHTQLMNRANSLMALLQKKMVEQKNKDEEERLKKMHEEMEKEKKRKEEEERKRKEEEEVKKIKLEMESRRKVEDDIRRKQEEEESKTIELIQAEQEKEATRLREQLEQERRDHELALRLAKESNSQVEELSVPKLSDSSKNSSSMSGSKKYDLCKWKYSELRDAINTSCDIELLEACKHEFHRRLKVYHAWKAKNKKKSAIPENERAPKSIMDEANRAEKLRIKYPSDNDGRMNHAQRYFRIPFAKRSPMNGTTEENGIIDNNNVKGKKGWWYAHFDGQYVARQMELHPDKQAILLIAGVDDMQMCELSLEETGLTMKKGAEILAQEFDREWTRHGGGPYCSPSQRAKQ